jgi:arsenical pump membrane protein
LHLVAGITVLLGSLVLIIVRPGGLPEWATALGGGVSMLLFGVLSPADAVGVLAANLNVFGFFLGLMAISALADEAGFFDALARISARLSGGNPALLMLNVMLTGVLITTFLTNDATALILTPVVYALVVRLRLEPLPFMFACTFIADTASFILPVSNPINVLVLTTFPQTLSGYLAHLLLPALVVTAGNIAIFLWIFRDSLSGELDLKLLEEGGRPARDGYFRFVVASLGAIAVAYVLASALSWPISAVALGGSGWLLTGALVARRVRWGHLGGEISWSIFGFIAGMLVVVRGIEVLGVTRAFGHLLIDLSGGHPLGAAFVSTFGAAVGANAINNVPASLVLVSAIRAATPPETLKDVLVYGTIIGADLGPNITTVGSLATVLWLLILRRKGLEVSSAEYFRLGITVTPALLALGAFALWLSSLWR